MCFSDKNMFLLQINDIKWPPEETLLGAREAPWQVWFLELGKICKTKNLCWSNGIQLLQRWNDTWNVYKYLQLDTLDSFWAKPLVTLSSARRLGPAICMRITLPCLPHSIYTIFIHTISCKPQQKDTDRQQDGGCVIGKDWLPIQGMLRQRPRAVVFCVTATANIACDILSPHRPSIDSFLGLRTQKNRQFQQSQTWLYVRRCLQKKKRYQNMFSENSIWSENPARLCLCKDLSK